MLHPKNFEVNEAWIAFRLNSAPIRVQHDGDFDCITLMDAASCFLLCTELVPVTTEEPARSHARQMLDAAQRHKQQLPKTLFVPRGDVAELITQEAAQEGIDVIRLPASELLVFTGEARQAFAERFEDAPLEKP